MMTTQGHSNGIAGAMVTAPQRTDLSVRFTAEQQRVIMDTCCGGAPPEEARALIAVAEARGLNPILGECYFVKRYDREARRDKWAVQASIDSLRIKAEQSGLYAGQDEPEFEHDKSGKVTLARVKVWRRDWPRPAVGVARWSEYVQTTRDGNPTRFWAQMPHNQLSKCAEALALRKAFPAVLSKIYIPEEMAQADNEAPRAAPALPAAPASDSRTFSDLCERVDTAESATALNAVARDTRRACDAGLISPSNLEAIKGAVTRKRGLLGAPVSAPDVSSHDDSSEAEAEVMAAQYDGDS